MRADFVIAAVILGLCGLGVLQQLRHDPARAPVVPPIAIGQALDGAITGTDLNGVERRVGEWFGDRATVLYSWSVPCSCVEECEARLRAIYAVHGNPQGVHWIAVDGEPTDSPEAVLDKMVKVGAFYRMLLDPSQRLSQRLGFDQAVQIAILDGHGYLRYRGPIDDDLEKPTRSYLREALEAVLAGTPVPEAEERPAVYGCAYSAPPDCDDPAASPGT
jgi:hypothetical protein